MKTKYLHVDQVHTYQAYKDIVYIGCSVYDEALDNFVDITLKIPAYLYLEEFAGNLKNIAKETYKAHLDSL